jgi:hypothetical protein
MSNTALYIIGAAIAVILACIDGHIREKHERKSREMADHIRRQIGEVIMLSAFLLSIGWQWDDGGMTDPDYNYRVDFSGVYGYAWALQKFSEAHWKSMDIEGDSLAELIAELSQIDLLPA